MAKKKEDRDEEKVDVEKVEETPIPPAGARDGAF